MESCQGNDDTRQPIFRLSGVSKVFENAEGGVRALQNVDLDIRAGEIFGIIGLSGAGKSTLIRCLNLLERPSSGDVYFRGVNLQTLGRKELLKARQKIGMIFQNFNLLQQRTALQNIRFPLEIAGWAKNEADGRAREMLELVGLSDKASAYPCQLSGGQQQRVAIARALASDPDVLLCDEATSALDPTTTASILSLLKSINKSMGVTVVIITHEMSVVQSIGDRVAVIDDGKIVEAGDVERVFRRPQSEVARALIFPKGELVERVSGHRFWRIVFDGTSAYEPIIANMTLACQTPVSILSADSRNIDGIMYGQMIVQVPEAEATHDRMLHYLESREVTVDILTGDEAAGESTKERA
jgi:D-methionine transport system ATP-binding protein